MTRAFLLLLSTVLTLLAAPAQALPTKVLDVNVHLLCDDVGNNCASQGPVGNYYFQDATNKIWDQADIVVNFAFNSIVNSSQYSYLTEPELGGLDTTHGVAGTSVVDLFLAHTITLNVGNVYGVADYNRAAAFISMDWVVANNRIDTIAHELGHLLGLVYYLSGWHSTDPNDLMADGGIRHIPSSLAHIAPDGLNYDRIPLDQVQIARGIGGADLLRDPYSAIPEPGILGLLGLGLLGLGLVRRNA